MLPNKNTNGNTLKFWVILSFSLFVYTRSNYLTTTLNIGSLTTFTKSSTSSSLVKLPGYRFILNQTAEDIRIKKQYAAKSSIPLCRRYQIINGQWLSVQYEKPPYVTTVKHLRCYPSETYRQSPWNTYTWMPDMAAVGACSFAEYDTNELCTLLPRATISIIGDSLSWEQYRSIVQLHNIPTRQGYQFQSYELNTNIYQSICDGGTTIVVYRRDDTLQNVAESIQQNFPTVLILNRGAHYVPDKELMNDMKSLIKTLKDWLHQCDEMKIECHLFWRTTVPGHVGCNDTKRAIHTPVYDIHDIEKQLILNKSQYNEIELDYHWYDFQHQNEMIIKILQKAELSNLQIIDAYYINVLRPDEHRYNDCLHNCYPGKMDVYNRLLLHYIKMQRSTNDIKRLQSVATKYDWPININTIYDEDATKLARDKRIEKELKELQENTKGKSSDNNSNKDDGDRDENKSSDNSNNNDDGDSNDNENSNNDDSDDSTEETSKNKDENDEND